MKIAIANDHTAIDIKKVIIEKHYHNEVQEQNSIEMLKYCGIDVKFMSDEVENYE